MSRKSKRRSKGKSGGSSSEAEAVTSPVADAPDAGPSEMSSRPRLSLSAALERALGAVTARLDLGRTADEDADTSAPSAGNAVDRPLRTAPGVAPPASVPYDARTPTAGRAAGSTRAVHLVDEAEVEIVRRPQPPTAVRAPHPLTEAKDASDPPTRGRRPSHLVEEAEVEIVRRAPAAADPATRLTS